MALARPVARPAAGPSDMIHRLRAQLRSKTGAAVHGCSGIDLRNCFSSIDYFRKRSEYTTLSSPLSCHRHYPVIDYPVVSSKCAPNRSERCVFYSANYRHLGCVARCIDTLFRYRNQRPLLAIRQKFLTSVRICAHLSIKLNWVTGF